MIAMRWPGSLAVGFLLVFGSVATAQEATLVGTVSDASGAVLPGVTVTAVHTASDIPVSALGVGESMFTGVMDNTDVFFKTMQAALGGEPRAKKSGRDHDWKD